MVTLEDLKRRPVDVTVWLSYERSVTVPLLMLSIHEWEEIGASVPDPVPPKTALDPNTGKPTINLADPDYMKARARANRDRTFRRLACALEGGGMAIPGKTWAEKAQAIYDMEAGIAFALYEVIRDSVERARSAIVEQADSFQRVSTGGDADVSAERVESGDVGGTP